ncbi:hypothetical protein H5410_060767 [Solanum commersonii]|uniref:Uncharacterized protein n=1 Tax=Solanum commersonii TaxID=4109 RepID=A0A9J5W6C6_SOLCO|nr:hypothetical protein H5410_060767 [Solanum commersonii]
MTTIGTFRGIVTALTPCVATTTTTLTTINVVSTTSTVIAFTLGYDGKGGRHLDGGGCNGCGHAI